MITVDTTITREQFAARNDQIQAKGEEYLIGSVRRALSHVGEPDWYNPLLKRVEQVARTAFRRESDQVTSDILRAGISAMREQVTTMLDQTVVSDSPKERANTANRIAASLAAYANAVGVEAAAMTDDRDIGLEWVTMADERVRPEHAAADGQVRRPGQTYAVGGYQMQRPGDVTVPIHLWINCRCVLRPTIMSVTASPTGDDMTDQIELTDTIEDIGMVDAGETVPFHGVLAPEGISSGDGRKFSPGAMRWRDLPLPLAWQKTAEPGHDGSVVVGRIDRIWRDSTGLIQADGEFVLSPEADEAIGLMAQDALRGVSVDVDDATMSFEDEDGNEVTFEAAMASETKVLSVITDGRICGATLVPIPAFMEAHLSLGPRGPEYDDVNASADTDDTYEADTQEYVNTHDAPGWLTHPVDTERLARYWTRGEGAAKIRWGVPGDFNRCRAQLAKYIKPMYLAGYCANRHYDALGFWPGRPVAVDTLTFAISEKPWDGSASRFTPEQWRRSCLIDTGEGEEDSKSRYKLPIKEPNGDLSRAGVHAAAGRINQTDASPAQISKARAALRRAYGTLGEDPPESLAGQALHLVASAHDLPPMDWFTDPGFIEPTRLTITTDRRIFGHLAQWGVCHIGISGVCTTPPTSPSDYAYFANGLTETDGGFVHTGVLTMGTGHADAHSTPRVAAAHYDNTGWAVARVAMGEDEHGIWFSGMLCPETTDEQIEQMRASGAVSGDWRTFTEDLELVAGLIVNVPGFPILGTQLAASGGRQTALVASGLVVHDPRHIEDIVADAVDARLALLDRRKRMENLKVRAHRDPASRMAALAAKRS